jgi:hypothetical protein
MSPEYVRPYVKAQKTDDRDAETIAEAATRPAVRFVEREQPNAKQLPSASNLASVQCVHHLDGQVRFIFSPLTVLMPTVASHPVRAWLIFHLSLPK